MNLYLSLSASLLEFDMIFQTYIFWHSIDMCLEILLDNRKIYNESEIHSRKCTYIPWMQFQVLNLHFLALHAHDFYSCLWITFSAIYMIAILGCAKCNWKMWVSWPNYSNITIFERLHQFDLFYHLNLIILSAEWKNYRFSLSAIRFIIIYFNLNPFHFLFLTHFMQNT